MEHQEREERETQNPHQHPWNTHSQYEEVVLTRGDPAFLRELLQEEVGAVDLITTNEA